LTSKDCYALYRLFYISGCKIKLSEQECLFLIIMAKALHNKKEIKNRGSFI
jgi:hypothetical protein